MTKRLYFDDPDQIEFEAEIIRQVQFNNQPGVILNQTCFYPTSGGQMCDRGFLNHVAVLDVFEHEGHILHLTEKRIDAQKVKGRISWKRRFDFMQQHSGQHLLSQTVLRVMKANTISSHLGEDTSSIEIEKERITDREIRETEDIVNTFVFDNRPITTSFISKVLAKNLPLRKTPPQKNSIRIVDIDNFDITPCGGTHCRRTGEIGLIKIDRWERIRNHIRLQFLCGGRVLSDYRWKSHSIDQMADLFSAKGRDVQNRVVKQFEENKSLRHHLKTVSNQLLNAESLQMLSSATPCGPFKIVCTVFDQRPIEEIKSLAMGMVKQEAVVVLFGNRGEKGQIVFACSKDLPFKMDDLVREAAFAIQGKGGGSPTLAFGGGPAVEELEKAIQKIFDRIVSQK